MPARTVPSEPSQPISNHDDDNNDDDDDDGDGGGGDDVEIGCDVEGPMTRFSKARFRQTCLHFISSIF